MADQQIAVLIDYENVGLNSIQWLFDQISDIGRVIVKRAYADWSTTNSKRDRDKLLELGIEPIHLFHSTGSGKNSSDIRLAIDAVDLLHQSPVDTFVIVSADSDFVPLVSKLRSAGKMVVGAGRRAAVSRTLVTSCDKFFYLDQNGTHIAESPARTLSPQRQPTDSLLVRAVRVAMDEQGRVPGSKLYQTLQRLDPGIDFRALGHSTFARYLEASPEVKVTRSNGPGDVTVELTEHVSAELETYGQPNGRASAVDTAWSKRATRTGQFIPGPTAAADAAAILGIPKLSASPYRTLQRLLDASDHLRTKWAREGTGSSGKASRSHPSTELAKENAAMEIVPSFRYRSYDLRLYAGKDSLRNLRSEVERARAKRAFVVCGQTVAHRTDLLARVREVLGDWYAGAFDGVKTNSPLPSVEAGTAAAREAGADLIVAVGGGSAVVTARAIVILLAEKGTAHDLCTKYRPGRPPESPRLLEPKIPNIAVLTTPTTAMNRAGTAVVDTERQHRLELFDPKTRPAALIWDADALMTAPPSVFLGASTAAFSGAATGLAMSKPDPIAPGDLLQALRLLMDNMPRLEAEPDNTDARMQLVAASFLTNRAADVEGGGGGDGGFGVITGLAHTLNTLCGECSYGAAYSILTPLGLRFNLEQTVAGQARLAVDLGAADGGTPEMEAATAAASAVEAFYRRVGMPVRLRDVGVPKEDIQRIAQDALEDFFLHRNARPIRDVDELAGILADVW